VLVLLLLLLLLTSLHLPQQKAVKQQTALGLVV
jgi:hypothetical protein